MVSLRLPKMSCHLPGCAWHTHTHTHTHTPTHTHTHTQTHTLTHTRTHCRSLTLKRMDALLTGDFIHITEVIAQVRIRPLFQQHLPHTKRERGIERERERERE